MNFLTILRNLSRLWWQKKDTISKSLQQPFKRRRGDGYTQISCLSKGLNATWEWGVISSYSYLQKNIFPLWTHSSPQHDGGLLGVPVALSQQPEHSSARTQLCQHWGVDMEVFPMWSKHFKPRGWLTNTSYSSVARICRTKHHFFSLFFFFGERDLAFGFDGGLYPGSIFIRVKVRSRYHSGEQRILTLRSQSKK